MTKSDLFKTAHKIAKENRSCFADYRMAFAWALKEAYAAASERFVTIRDWFQAKTGISSYAFSERQIVSETEKAVRVRTAVFWRGGVSVIKDVWIPKSVCSFGVCESDLGEGALPYAYKEIVGSVEAGQDCFEFSKNYAKTCAAMFC